MSETHMADRPANGRSGLPVAITPQHGGTLAHLLVAALQLALLLLLYSQTQTFDYAYFDDTEYVLKNPAVLAGLGIDGAQWAFTSFYMSNWHPLTWLSHMLDVSLFGVEPGWAHLHNVALHGINSLLVYALLLRYSGSWAKACVLSLIFLVHPLHVESVAWIAERKDLLCALFFLLGLILYDDFRARAGRLRYAGVLLCFALALLAKPMAVTFPVVLVILDFFVYRHCFLIERQLDMDPGFDYAGVIVEKLPFIALSAAACTVTIIAQDAGNAVAYLKAHSLASRWEIATNAYVIYLRQSLLPVDLIAFYPINGSSSLLTLLLPSAFLGVVLVLCLLFASAYPLIAAGLCWYLATLLPVIGLVQVGSQAHADRYMYLPSVGILMACTYLLPLPASRHFRLAYTVALTFIVYLSVICYWQVGYWKNHYVLFSRALAVAGPSYLVHLHLSEDYMRRGILQDARQHGLAAMKLRPDAADSYQALGNIALAEKKYPEAEKLYRSALSRGPAQANIVNNLGITLAEQGNIPAGIRAFHTALEIEPGFSEAQQNLEIYNGKLQLKGVP